METNHNDPIMDPFKDNPRSLKILKAIEDDFPDIFRKDNMPDGSIRPISKTGARPLKITGASYIVISFIGTTVINNLILPVSMYISSYDQNGNMMSTIHRRHVKR